MIFLYIYIFQGNYSTPQYRVEEENGCLISSINETSLMFETPNPYTNNNRCKAEFTCPDDKVISYTIERFDIYSEEDSIYDRLGMYNL